MTPQLKDRFKVLVVDDDPSVLATYRRLLRRAGYATVTEGDPLNVLNGHAGAGIDLLLLDYKMPGMDGLSLLAELRRRACRARCILVSAFLNDDVRSQAATLGVDRVLEKPVDACHLRRVIDDLLTLTGGFEVRPSGVSGPDRAGT
jgi:CheY-like chemotaxis protein